METKKKEREKGNIRQLSEDNKQTKKNNEKSE